MIMDLSIRTVKKIEISEVTPLFDEKNEEDWYQRTWGLTYNDPENPNTEPKDSIPPGTLWFSYPGAGTTIVCYLQACSQDQ